MTYVPVPCPFDFQVGTWVRLMNATATGDYYDGKHYTIPVGQVGQIYEISDSSRMIHIKLFTPRGRPTLCTAFCDVESTWRVTRDPQVEPWVLGPYTRFDHEAPI